MNHLDYFFDSVGLVFCLFDVWLLYLSHFFMIKFMIRMMIVLEKTRRESDEVREGGEEERGRGREETSEREEGKEEERGRERRRREGVREGDMKGGRKERRERRGV